MNRCETCRFWNRNGDGPEMWDDEAIDCLGSKGDYVQTQHRKCLRIIHGNGHDARGKASGELAMVRDGSGYAASLWTRAEFGCSLHEPTESSRG